MLGPPAYYPRFGFDPVLARKVKGPMPATPSWRWHSRTSCLRDLPIEVAFATPFEDFE